jgi:hypothetical protein
MSRVCIDGVIVVAAFVQGRVQQQQQQQQHLLSR